MKIGILTLPLINNYGGILQAFALLKTLNKLNYNSFLIDKKSYPKSRFYFLKIKIKYLFYYLVKKEKKSWVLSNKEREKREKERSVNTSFFINKYVQPRTKAIYSSKELIELSKDFDAIIVGSDQVWRPKYTDNIYDYYLSFVEEQACCKKIAYAASFGTDSWEYSMEEEKECSRLIKLFKAISVREISGVNLCQSKLGVNVSHVLDPTMLLTAKDYIEIIKIDSEKKSTGDLMVYLLDRNSESNSIVDLFSKDYTVFNFESSNVSSNPRVEEWIRGFYDAQFIITDSFHGCVFSILFNKPFIAIGNLKRGVARFESLLSTFNLEDRLLTGYNKHKIYALKSEAIDWDPINKILEQRRKESLAFLTNSLS